MSVEAKVADLAEQLAADFRDLCDRRGIDFHDPEVRQAMVVVAGSFGSVGLVTDRTDHARWLQSMLLVGAAWEECLR